MKGVSSSEFGRQWLENWAESREREIEQETHMRFEADVHKALQESLKEMMGEFSGHELADFTRRRAPCRHRTPWMHPATDRKPTHEGPRYRRHEAPVRRVA